MLMTGKTSYTEGTMNTLEAFPPDILTSLPAPRLTQTHLYPQHVPEKYKQDKLRIIYVYRYALLFYYYQSTHKEGHNRPSSVNL